MKTMIKHSKLWLSILIGLAFAQTGHAQDIDLDFRYDPAPFIGKWTAQSGNRTFELNIQEHRYYAEPIKKYGDILLGELIYKTNGVVTRHLTVNGLDASLTGSPNSSSEIWFLFSDRVRKVYGSVTMTLSPTNAKKATWKLEYREHIIGSGWNELDFDIPRELEWTKTSDSPFPDLPPGDPFKPWDPNDPQQPPSALGIPLNNSEN